MSVMLIAQNETRESGSFMGDQLCSLKVAYLFVRNQPDVDRVIMSVSPGNEMHFLWTKFIEDPRGDGSIPPVMLVYDDWNPGDWESRWRTWDRWRKDRCVRIEDGSTCRFDHYRELYLRIHGSQRQREICGSERGLNRKNIFEYWLAGQENCPDVFPGADCFDDTLIHHPPLRHERDVYISPHAKTQGNVVFTFDFWSDVVHRLVDNDITVTVGYDGWFCEDLKGHPNYRKHWGDHRQWMEEICRHKLVACGNTGTGWLACACGVPMITMEPHNSVMADHRYRECGLRNILEMIDGTKLDELNNNMPKVADYVTNRITDEIRRCVVMTTGCYDIIHAGHVRHLEKSRSLGTKLIVALNSDESVRSLKGPQRPINPQNQRKAVLEALRCVDEVRIFDGLSAIPLIQELKPDILACGFGYTPDTIVGRDIVEGYGGKVVVTYEGDASNEPSTTKIVRAVRTSDVWSAVRAGGPYSVNPPEKLQILAEQLVSTSSIQGDIADMGSFRGGTALIMSRIAPTKRLHVFDTWRGNPYDDPLCHHKKGEWQASLDDCRALVGNGEMVYYWEGVFPDNVNPELVANRLFSFVYVDMDTYQSTRDAIDFFWPRLAQGGKMVFDDYDWNACAGVKKAVDESFPDGGDFKGSVVQYYRQNYTCVVEKK